MNGHVEVSVAAGRVRAEVVCVACEGGWRFASYGRHGRTYQAAAPCEACVEQRARAASFTAALIPARFAAAQLTDEALTPAQRSAAQRIGRWVESVAIGLRQPPSGAAVADTSPAAGDALLCGPPGIGKTHLVVGALRSLTLEHGVPCRYVTFPGLVRHSKALIAQGGDVQAVLAELAAVAVLACDELGAGRATDWELDLVHGIVAERYDACRPTIWATNYHPPPAPPGAPLDETLEGRLGDHAVSRILGAAGDRVIRMVSGDLRRGVA